MKMILKRATLDHLDGGDKPGSAVFCISSPSVDRDRDSVNLTMDSFKNWEAAGAPWFSGHESGKIGVATSIGDDGTLNVWQGSDGRWYAKCFFDLGDPDSARVYRALKTRRLGAASVAFVPSPQTRKNADGGHDFFSPDISEISIVGVPSQPEATLVSVKSLHKPITDAERDAHYNDIVWKDQRWRNETVEKFRTQADTDSGAVPWGTTDGKYVESTPDSARAEIMSRYDDAPPNDQIEGSERQSYAEVLAALYSHANEEAKFMARYGSDIGYGRKAVLDRMDQLRQMFQEAYPDADLDALVSKFEQDADAGSAMPEPGEAGLVAQGRVPPEKKKRFHPDIIKGRIRRISRALVERKLRETEALLRSRGFM
jgi:hypothetical protein